MAQLGTTYLLLRDYQEAVKLLEESLSGFKMNLAEEHPRTLSVMTVLANCYNKMGHVHESLDLNEWVLDIRRRVSGELHPRTLKVMLALAWTYSCCGRQIEAENLAEQAAHSTELVFGPAHREAARARGLLAKITAKGIEKLDKPKI